MACGCEKNGQKPVGYGMTQTRTQAQTAADEAAARAANPSVARIGPALATTGTTQSFALMRNGRTMRFGSRLERDAEAARHGGSAV